MYDLDYYQRINAEEATQAERLAELLIWKYNPKTVVDVGCATGLYLRPFLDKGIVGWGIDNAETAISPEVMRVPRRNITIADITKESVKRPADLAICLEVLEHIPAEGAEAAVKYLTTSAALIIFSAAHPGQGGVGHVNCQPKQYWEGIFTNLGFERQPLDEYFIKTIMAAGYHMGWLIMNLMVFTPTKPNPTIN